LSRVAETLAGVPDVRVVGEATTLAQSLQLLATLHPDVVVADLHLPDGDGRQVLAAAKRELPNSHVLILTNHAYPPLRQSCLALGADAFLDKANEFEQVSTIVGGWSHAA
jgi:DNA-binding NarL/FixJ family response regulator